MWPKIHHRVIVGLVSLGLLLTIFSPRTIFSPGLIFGQNDPLDLSSVYQNAFIIPSPAPISTFEAEVLGTFTTAGPSLNVAPIDPTASVVITKIGVNSPIVFDTPIQTSRAYEDALKKGVAHAAGTAKPNPESGNVYLFAHSTSNVANIARYAAVFTRLNELHPGDRISVFYLDKRYDYRVVDSKVVPSFAIDVLTSEFPFPALTLQTCDPPGVPQNRLLVVSQLAGVFDR